jgi:hypothetical protein
VHLDHIYQPYRKRESRHRVSGCETSRNEVEANVANLRMRDLQPERRAWQSADTIQMKSRSNIPNHCETAGPHNCRLVVDLRSVRHDQSGGSGAIREFLSSSAPLNRQPGNEAATAPEQS